MFDKLAQPAALPLKKVTIKLESTTITRFNNYSSLFDSIARKSAARAEYHRRRANTALETLEAARSTAALHFSRSNFRRQFGTARADRNFPIQKRQSALSICKPSAVLNTAGSAGLKLSQPCK